MRQLEATRLVLAGVCASGVVLGLGFGSPAEPSRWLSECESASVCPDECARRMDRAPAECAPGVHALLSCAAMTGGFRCGASGHAPSPVVGIDPVEWLPECPKNVLWLAACSCAPDLHDDACAACVKTSCCQGWRAYLSDRETAACAWGRASCDRPWPAKDALAACTGAYCADVCS